MIQHAQPARESTPETTDGSPGGWEPTRAPQPEAEGFRVLPPWERVVPDLQMELIPDLTADAVARVLARASRHSDVGNREHQPVPFGQDAPAAPALRRRVLTRDGFRCRCCGSPFDLHAHHVVFREHGGPVAVQASHVRQRPVDHVLLTGPAGLGKTTLAGALAAELGARLHTTTRPALKDGFAGPSSSTFATGPESATRPPRSAALRQKAPLRAARTRRG